MQVVAVFRDFFCFGNFQNPHVILQQTQTAGGAGIDDVVSRVDIVGKRSDVFSRKGPRQRQVAVSQRGKPATHLGRQDDIDVKGLKHPHDLSSDVGPVEVDEAAVKESDLPVSAAADFLFSAQGFEAEFGEGDVRRDAHLSEDFFADFGGGYPVGQRRRH